MNAQHRTLCRRILLTFAILATSLDSASARSTDLPPDLQVARREIIEICQANTLRDDNIKAVRAQLEPRIALLASWFNANRPADEVGLTQKPWKSIWYDDPTIDEFSNGTYGPVRLSLDRNQIYQVVENGYYYNVSEGTMQIGQIPIRFQTYLKGAYSVANPATPANVGQPRLNVVDLRFVLNGVRFGPLANGVNLRGLVQAVNLRLIPLSRVPGPIGVTGELWNVYIDEQLRISAGFEDDKKDTIDLYILLRTDRTVP